MKLTGFTPTADGTILVEYRDGSEEGWYPIGPHVAAQVYRQLGAAIAKVDPEWGAILGIGLVGDKG